MSEEKKWLGTEYLKNGNSRQKLCYAVISETMLIERLAEFQPLVVGTIPIGIDIPGSDLDVVCGTDDLHKVRRSVRRYFSHYPAFTESLNENVYVAGFEYKGLPVEVYAECRASFLQNGYRHMVVEDRILRLAGEEFRMKIVGLKLDGLKTEPAFGILLGLEEPYSALLVLADMPDVALSEFIRENVCFV